jgi:outer membrane lipoprotein-sorting protein
MRFAPLLLAFAVVVPLAPAARAAEDAMALVRRYDAVMSPPEFQSETVMVAHREDGTTRTYKMSVLKSGKDKLRATFLEPSSAKGQEMLRNGDNMWLWMPNLKRAVRVASRDSFMGGDFNNADVMRVNYEADYTPSVVDCGKPELVCLELKAKSPQVAYDVVKLTMTAGTDPMPVRAEFYAASGKLLRSADFSDVKELDKGFKRPTKIVMKNELQKQRFSEMTWNAMTLKDSISAQRFVVDDLGR